MATAPLVPVQVQATMQNVTLQALGLNPDDAGYAAVRVGWQTAGQPANLVPTEDVVYVTCLEVDDEYNRIRDQQNLVNDDESLEIVTTYTRVWNAVWNFYGPNSFDNARIVKSALLRPSQPIHDLLITANLYLVTRVTAPRRVPEVIGGLLSERIDFEAEFNEGVTEIEVVSTILSTEVIVENAQGVIADIIVT